VEELAGELFLASPWAKTFLATTFWFFAIVIIFTISITIASFILWFNYQPPGGFPFSHVDTLAFALSSAALVSVFLSYLLGSVFRRKQSGSLISVPEKLRQVLASAGRRPIWILPSILIALLIPQCYYLGYEMALGNGLASQRLFYEVRFKERGDLSVKHLARIVRSYDQIMLIVIAGEAHLTIVRSDDLVSLRSVSAMPSYSQEIEYWSFCKQYGLTYQFCYRAVRSTG
jgi:hypothetical protein